MSGERQQVPVRPISECVQIQNGVMWNIGRDAAREIDDNDDDVKPAGDLSCPVTQSWALFHPITLAHPRSHLHTRSFTSAAPSTRIYFRVDWTDREVQLNFSFSLTCIRLKATRRLLWCVQYISNCMLKWETAVKRESRISALNFSG